MKTKDINIICPHCNSDMFDKIYNHQGIGQIQGEFEYECFMCYKDFKVKYTVETLIEYEI